MADDPLDFTGRYNTPLDATQESQFQNWAAAQSKVTGRDVASDTYDYDLRGFWKANPDFSYADPSQHLTDQYKKPNHPTFSTQSQYHNSDNPGGTWSKHDDGTWSFIPGAANMQMHGADGLQDYFRRQEPGNKLMLPVEHDPFTTTPVEHDPFK